MTTAILEAPEALEFPEETLRPLEPGPGFEFVDGALKELNVSKLSSFIAGECHGFLREYVRPRGLGWVFPEGASYRCFPDDPTRVRRADTAFHVLSRLTNADLRAEGHNSVCPDLVVEVVSPNDSADEVNIKRIEWQQAGATLVWVIHPTAQTVHAYCSDGSVRLFTAAGSLTAEPLLHEFCLPMAELFRLPTAAGA